MDVDLKRMLLPALIAFLFSALLFVVRGVAFGLLHRWAERTETKLDNIIIKSFRAPSIYWCIAVGLYIGVAVSDIPERYAFYLTKTIHVIIILSITLATSSLAGKMFRNYAQLSSLPIPTTGLAYGILKGTILMIGILITLSVLGISIAPLITALGVGGLAVALALKDTLSNLFAGIHILMEKSVRVGDWIRLETGEEGLVADITWRTTRIRMPSNNMVVVPNSKLAQSALINYNLPEKRLSVRIRVGVSYSADPETVERVLIEEAGRAAEELPFILAEPPPSLIFSPGFGESSLDFTLVCSVREFGDQPIAENELRKRVFKRLKKEGIEIPFPHRTVYLREEADWKRKYCS